MTATPFVNEHLSYSRLARYESCPLSYRLHYIDKRAAEPGVPLQFGKLIHAVLETLVREHMHEERTGPLSLTRAVDLYRESWAKTGMAGLELFQEGLDIIEDFVREQGELDHRDVLAVEKEFRLSVGRFTVLGFIDRVDYLDEESVEVIDYKTNRQLFSREEVDHSLQLSLYHLAARQLWPWVKRVKLTYHMLRHNLRQTTQRTPEQLAATLTYVETIGAMTEEANDYPARLNSNCIYCDHRRDCPAYAEALEGKPEFLCQGAEDLATVAREREHVARLAKILYRRKDELDKVIKTHLAENDELLLNGVRYKLFNTARLNYPVESTLRVLEGTTGISRDSLISRVASIDNKAIEQLLKETVADRAKARLLKLELESLAEKSYSPRLWAKEVSV